MSFAYNEYPILSFFIFLLLIVATYKSIVNFISLFDKSESAPEDVSSINDDFTSDISNSNDLESKEDYYKKILGVGESFNSDNLKRMYRTRVSEYHPDKVAFLGPKLKAVAENEIKEINEAYSFLKSKYNF
jgi:DnaJ-domain-containing protein 1